jgi:hypothetical protein
MRTALILLSGLIVATPLAAQRGSAPFTVAETGETFRRLQDAVSAIGGDTGTIRIAPGRYRDCAVQEAGHVTFAAAEPGTAIFDAAICEGKATLVLRGRSARVEGLTFTHMAVEDGNGAGIRIEQGDLFVSESLFVDGQSGILSAVDPDGRIAIDRSTFSGLGLHPDGNGAHSVYVGHYGALTVTRTRFERGTGGHYLKSRAPRIAISDSSFDDSNGHTTNYLIDLPEGATGRIAGNIFVNGTGKENYNAMIAVGAEARANSSAGLLIEGNDVSVAPGFRWQTNFVADWSGDALILRNNRLAPGIRPFVRR